MGTNTNQYAVDPNGKVISCCPTTRESGIMTLLFALLYFLLIIGWATRNDAIMACVLLLIVSINVMIVRKYQYQNLLNSLDSERESEFLNKPLPV